MKKSVFIVVIAMLSAAHYRALVAQESQDQINGIKALTEVELKEASDIKENLQIAGNAYLMDYNKFKKSAGIKFTTNEIRIDEMKAAVLNMNVKDKSAVNQKKVSDLVQRNSKLKRELSGHKNEGPDEWKAYKTEFNRDMDELSKALKDFTIIAM